MIYLFSAGIPEDFNKSKVYNFKGCIRSIETDISGPIDIGKEAISGYNAISCQT